MFDKKAAYDVLTSTKLTHEQKLMNLARIAENGLDILKIPQKTKLFFENGSINDLFEGHAPYRPRYIMPDYNRFIKNGSDFLQINPPTDLDELLTSLMILYRHVPSITNFPVYLGNLDKMIDPFLDNYSDEEVCKKLKLFLTYLDRTITDSFCHANIGPEETRAGRLLLKVEKELQNAVPNFTIKYDPDITSDAFAEEAIKCSLISSNPAICNHKANKEYYEGEYGISSCYNILPVSGGAYTLVRLTLTKLALEADSLEQFMDELLPDSISCMGDYLNERIRFLVEESGFFESNFLVKEGLISKDRFVAMFGITGLAECVNTLLKDKDLKYGRDLEADQLANKIMDTVHVQVQGLTALYSPLTDGKFVLHAQVGLESDIGVTSGVRIPVGEEPESFIDHLTHSARYHKYFPSGVGDIFPIATNVEQNPASLLDVVKGAFMQGVHYMSFYAADSDLVRITGYLVKRSEIEKYNMDEAVLQNTTHLGAPTYEVNKLAERKVRMI
ncbi:YjjI family glycine radical enzyme [Bacillus massiliigorillae]|uniref:YjjI family glycine radical enzyme n=1 Tax=Bacillus massiliigorillae TaxID=1243664 RepID=UPI0003A3B7F3|nr:YjjI family glycine radical enzyme [Bacillus massiliigorillae]